MAPGSHSETGRTTRPGNGPVAARVASLFVGDMPAWRLAGVAGVPVLLGAWLLLSPDRLLSREMTVDLLFNLSGAWRLLHAHVPHVDYHDPVGVLGFLLTRLGFGIVGPVPQAFLVGELIFLAFIFLTAVIAAARRLPPLPAIIFVLYGALLVLLPANIGDQPNAYSFAMSYNRWGWSAITTLSLILFLPPRDRQAGAAIDAAIAGLLLLAMFYLKITFGAAGVVTLVVALVVSPHIRDRWRLWSCTLVLVLANVAAPYSHAYLADIWEAANAGYVRASWTDHLRSFLANKAEYGLYASGVLVLVWLWCRGQVPWPVVIAAGFIFGLGVALLTQNAQVAGTPVCMVIAFLIYEAVRPSRADITAAAEIVPRLLAILVFPVLSIAAAAMTLGGYHVAAKSAVAVLTVDATNLRGLAVPADLDVAQASFASGEVPYQIRSRARDIHPGHDAEELSQFEYVQSLLEAAALFADGERGPARILVIDQVNPLPFMLGYPPPHGGNLWLWPGAPVRPVEDVFADVDYVLIPKKPTFIAATLKAVAHYRPYLAEAFVVRAETARWTILDRRHSTTAVMPYEDRE